MKLINKDRSGSTKATPVNKKENNLETKLLKERTPVKGKDIAALVLDLMWSEEGNDDVSG